jgi:DNA-binding MarR family transcriptional regulator
MRERAELLGDGIRSEDGVGELPAIQQQVPYLTPEVSSRPRDQDHATRFVWTGSSSPCTLHYLDDNIRKPYHMNSRSAKDRDVERGRRRSRRAIKGSLRELSTQLSLLNHRVGANLDLKDVDLDCLDIVARHGPLSPSALARRSGLHRATMTGVLDRLERGGWVARERDPSDRRAVVVRALSDRDAELLRLYSGMNASMDRICAGYGDAELELLADFLRRTADAGRSATDELSADY